MYLWRRGRMTTQTIRTGPVERQWPRTSARRQNEDPAIPPALAFLMACAASVVAWVVMVIAAYLVLGRPG
jgi:hypothetical protein